MRDDMATVDESPAGEQMLAGGRAGDFLAPPEGATFPAEEALFGWGGLHGGVILARLAGLMVGAAAVAGGDGNEGQGSEPPALRSVSARFLRAVRRDAEVGVSLDARGRTVVGASAEVRRGGQALVAASSIFGSAAAPSNGASAESGSGLAPTRPDAPGPEHCRPFSLGELAPPAGRLVDIRPADDRRPFAGSSTPELTAWLRVVVDDRPPDLARLVYLADSLAPAWSAVLAEPALLPTIELTVRPTHTAGASRSPWVLLRTTAVEMSTDGWCRERIDIWDEAGVHLAAADQLRLLLG